jgi:tellurite resistance protein TerC
MIWLWIGFILGVLLLLALDLGYLNREAHAISTGEALAWTSFWVSLALSFNVAVYYMYEHRFLGIGGELSGWDAALQFFTGYLVEESLSLDNIFVIALIIGFFGVPLKYQHRVLFWGILGAIVLRGTMILLGSALIHRFEWVIYIFGGLLIFTAARLLVTRHDTVEPGANPIVKFAKKLYPVTGDFHEERFFIQKDGKRVITPLFLALICIESSDVVFAIDSIPAIFAVTRDPFIVFTSNVFAILGLRSLYFALAALMEKFRYLKISLVFLLAYVGVKMLLSHHYPIPTHVSLFFIVGILSVGVLASILGARRDKPYLPSPLGDDLETIAELTWKQAKRIVTILLGTSTILVGIALLVLPGPGTVVLFAGLAILGTEFAWARRWLKKIKEKSIEVARNLTE